MPARAGASELCALFVTGRLGSSRLPRKMLLDIAGRPALWYSLDRMKDARLPDLRVVCTSTAPRDLEIEGLARRNGWLCWRGDEEDVLQRYAGAAAHFNVDFFVNVDGDDLFCGVEYVDRMIELYRDTKPDYICCEGLPFGGAPTGVKVSALDEVCRRKAEIDTQGWGKYFLESGLFTVEVLVSDESVRRPNYRMSLDYDEDLDFFRAVVAALDPSHQGRLSLVEVVAYLDTHPEIAAISQQMSVKYWARFNELHRPFDHEPFCTA